MPPASFLLADNEADNIPLARSDGGSILTIASAISNVVAGAGSTFVFRPGDPAGNRANIYVTWQALQTAYALVAGPKWIQLDNIFQAIVIPVGAWSLEDATITPSFAAPQPGIVTMTWTAGATFGASHVIFRSVKVVASATITTVGQSGNLILELDALASIVGSPGEGTVPLIVQGTPGGTLTIQCYGGSQIGDGTNNVIDVLAAGILSVELSNASQALGHWLIGANTGSAFASADPTSFVSPITDGTIVPTLDQFAGGPTFVFQPGGTPGGNTFITWQALMTAIALVSGPKSIFVDASIATATVPAGTWNVDQVTFVGNGVNGPLGAAATLNFANGAVLNFETISLYLILFQGNSNSAIIPVGTTNRTIIAQVSQIQSGTATAFIQHTNAAGSIFFICANDVFVGDGSHPVFSSTVASGGSMRLIGSTLFGGALVGTGTITVGFDSTSSPNLSLQTVTTLTLVYLATPNIVQATGNTGSGGASVTVTTGNISRLHSGKMQISASALCSTSAAATITVQLQRSGVNIGTAQTLVAGAALSGLGVSASFVDTAPDNANHTYSLVISVSAGAVTVAANSAQISVVEET